MALPKVTYLNGEIIGLFGLSANPPSGLEGHVGIVRYLVQSNLFSEVWVFPVYQHMYQSKRVMESYDHRIEMCRLCMVNLSLLSSVAPKIMKFILVQRSANPIRNVV